MLFLFAVLKNFLKIRINHISTFGKFPSLLSNAFEAIIGALYLEAGLDKARTISIKLLEEVHPDISLDTLFKDYKTTLQEMTQALFGTTPEYKLVGSHGPDHKKSLISLS